VVFGRDGNDTACIGAGWARPEPVHRWSLETESDLVLNRPGDTDALLVFDIGAFVHPPAVAQQRLFVQVNDTSVGMLTVTDNRLLGLRVPALAFAAHEMMRLRFSHPDAASPADFGISGDKRRLGMCFRRLRVFCIAAPAPGRIEGRGGIGLAEVETRTGLPPEQLVTRFESLGDSGEFGLVQRQAGAEPLGLLRFAMLGLPHLVQAIERGFEGTGDRAMLRHTALPGGNGRRIHDMRDQACGLSYRLEQIEDGLDDETLITQQARKLKMLRGVLLDDMAEAEKIFVFRRHPSRGELTEAEILPLLQALRQHGPCTLLFIVLADRNNPAGTVTRIVPGLLCGYLDSLMPYHGATQVSLDIWLEICANALALGGE